ncbi:phage virion morphogenesis protein [Xenorhabdus cabanillasii]|uniref:Predicted virion morphogenesis protein n=1 Tax=Xenorhabdus cabanillasii JM26 TaxID=1427517 RepID=W1ISI5_9GAMM|nr:phage virion morphogenesis protein [Xenorhabdus cabanillasii]PHM76057.1 phage morphogeneis protein [Xenorhabdus cabanillasii JM26]CDL80195.1 Predicted virion morphogenesis protein [Xenorhabdus cabanillasii JM26]
MFQIEIDLKEFQQAMQQLTDGLGDRTPMMRQIAGIMADAVEENFKQQGRPAWLGWRPATAKKRAGGKILQHTGRLASSIQQFSDNDEALVGTNVKYARIHQEGGTINMPARRQNAYYRMRKDGTVGHRFVQKSKSNYSERNTIPAYKIQMPARPFLTLTDSDTEQIQHILERYLQRLLD